MILHRQVFMNIKIAKKIVFGCMLVGMTCFLNATEVVNMDIPPLEKSFISIMNESIDEYATTTNKAIQKNILFDLGTSLSNLLKDRVAKDWVGEVLGVWTDHSDGSARVIVTLPVEYEKKLVGVGSLNNKAEDDKFHIHTGIDIGSDLYNAISKLEKGDKVVFSGRFASITPKFILPYIAQLNSGWAGMGIFQLTSIKKIQSVKKSK